MLFFCERAQYLYCKQWSCIFHRNLRYTFTITGNSQNPDWITWERPFGARISLYLCVCACMHLALSQLCEIDRITHNPRITPAKGSEEMFFLYCNKNVSRSKSVIVKSLKRERATRRCISAPKDQRDMCRNIGCCFKRELRRAQRSKRVLCSLLAGCFQCFVLLKISF